MYVLPVQGSGYNCSSRAAVGCEMLRKVTQRTQLSVDVLVSKQFQKITSITRYCNCLTESEDCLYLATGTYSLSHFVSRYD